MKESSLEGFCEILMSGESHNIGDKTILDCLKFIESNQEDVNKATRQPERIGGLTALQTLDQKTDLGELCSRATVNHVPGLPIVKKIITMIPIMLIMMVVLRIKTIIRIGMR